jgi:hypothetical protein
MWAVLRGKAIMYRVRIKVPKENIIFLDSAIIAETYIEGANP